MKRVKQTISGILACVMVLCLVPMMDAGAYGTGTVGQPTVLSAGTEYSALVSEGNLWLWGDNQYSQMGDGTQEDYQVPTWVMDQVSSVSLGNGHVTVLKTDGSLWQWGANGGGIIPGCADSRSQKAPLKVMDDVVAAASGMQHSAAIKSDGSLWCWGYNGDGQIGIGATEQTSGIEPVKILENVKSMALGNSFSLALKTDGTVWQWGKEKTPEQIMSGGAAVALGHGGHAAVIKTDGSLWMWGWNSHGQVGNGEATGMGGRSAELTKVMDNVVEVALGENHSAAIQADGSLWTWGENRFGQLGNGSLEGSAVPVKVMENAAAVALGGDHSLAIDRDGRLWAWGSNSNRALGLAPAEDDVRRDGTPCKVLPTLHEGFSVAVPDVGPKCTVWLELNGGEGETSVQCNQGGLLTPPNNPSKEGYYFAGWFKDEACTIPWNFDTDRVNEDMTLYAKWESKSTSTVIAEPSSQTTVLDGQEVIFNTYILRDERGFEVNFVKLRDVAYVLNGTAAQFNVDWRNNAIRLDPKSPYTTPNGAEMTVPSVISAPAQTSVTPVLTDGYTAPLEAFLLTDANDGGHNYFKLRDIGKVAGFDVRWDDARGCIVITTTKPYSGE